MSDAGLPPDPWQLDVLTSTAARVLLLCCRQSGKSTVAAALAVLTALVEAPALVLLLSPSLRQSGELFRQRVLPYFRAISRGVKVVRQTALEIELANGSRVVSLPENEEGIRGFSSVSLLVIDEAARVADSLYCAVRPMLATSNGRLIGLSTPFGRRGWFHDEWFSPRTWERVRITAEQCPRISLDFLAEERESLGPRWFAQEYHCSFEDAIDSVFRAEDIEAALSADVEPLFVGA
jgi:hypothetical protein